MIFVHRKVIASKDIAVITGVNAPQIHAVFDFFRMSNHLLVVSRVRCFKFHISLHLTIKESTCVWSLGVSSCRNLSVENSSENWNFRPWKIVVHVNVNIFPGPVLRVF
jgi:hypothetical protein